VTVFSAATDSVANLQRFPANAIQKLTLEEKIIKFSDEALSNIKQFVTAYFLILTYLEF